MKKNLAGVGLLVLAAAFVLGLAGYVGLWVCYIGAIVDFIDQCKAPTTSAGAIALCLLRFFVGGSLALAVGLWGGLLTGAAGLAVLFSGSDNPKPPRHPLWKPTPLPRDANTLDIK